VCEFFFVLKYILLRVYLKESAVSGYLYSAGNTNHVCKDDWFTTEALCLSQLNPTSVLLAEAWQKWPVQTVSVGLWYYAIMFFTDHSVWCIKHTYLSIIYIYIYIWMYAYVTTHKGYKQYVLNNVVVAHKAS